MGGRLALALAALVVALLVSEAAVRLLDRARCLMSFSGGFWEPDPHVGWRLTAGAAGWAKHCIGPQVEWRTFTRINQLGLRDRDIPYARRDAFRILVLGDSMTEGLQVDAGATFPKVLERRLNAGASRAVEVINAGCSGYGTDNELLFYRDEGRRYRPDLVLLVFNTWNDVLENYRPLLEHAGFGMYPPKPYFLPEQGGLVLHDYPLAAPARWRTLRARANRALWRHSTLYRLVVTLGLPRVAPVALAAERPAGRPNVLGVLLKRYPPEWRAAWGVTARLVQRLEREVAEDGARLAVVVLTSGWEVSDDRWMGMLLFSGQQGVAADYDRDKPTRIMSGLLRRLRIPSVALLAPFRTHFGTRGTAGYFVSDYHLHDDGHAFAAEAIERGLVEQGLLPAVAR